ncbi:hypothetical protein Esti_006034 [Eimeria stiedai]
MLFPWQLLHARCCRVVVASSEEKRAKVKCIERREEDSLQSLKTDFVAWFDRLQHGSPHDSQDPVFEGMVRDFLQYDAALQAMERGVRVYMEGVESLCCGLNQLSEAAVLGLTKRSDAYIARDACRYRESIHRITRADGPHTCFSKMRRDLIFNVVDPLRCHRAHNDKLKQDFQVRRRRLAELVLAKRHVEHLQQQQQQQQQEQQQEPQREDAGEDEGEEEGEEDGLIGGSAGAAFSAHRAAGTSRASHQQQRQRRSGASSADAATAAATAAAASAYMRFKEIDDVLFEWLEMLQSYKCDIFDSLLQTLKYIQYEFFAGAAHAVNAVIPKRMEFRPMVEMTPQQLQPQVELELEARSEEPEMDPSSFSFGSGHGVSATERLVEKWERDAAAAASASASAAAAAAAGAPSSKKEQPAAKAAAAAAEAAAVEVDILSLAVLTGQGFGERESRAALLRFNNDTQGALDWLLDGGADFLLLEQQQEERQQQQQQELAKSTGGGAAAAAAAASSAVTAAAAMAASRELDDVRLPTTLKWVERLKQARRQEALSWKERRAKRDAADEGATPHQGQQQRGPPRETHPHDSLNHSVKARKGAPASAAAGGGGGRGEVQQRETRRTRGQDVTNGSRETRRSAAAAAAAERASDDEAPQQQPGARASADGSSRSSSSGKGDNTKQNSSSGSSSNRSNSSSNAESPRSSFPSPNQQFPREEGGPTSGKEAPPDASKRGPSSGAHPSQPQALDLLDFDGGGPPPSSASSEGPPSQQGGGLPKEPEKRLVSHDVALLDLDGEDEGAPGNASSSLGAPPGEGPLKTLPLPGLLGSFDARKCAWSNEKEAERKVREETEELRRRIKEEEEERRRREEKVEGLNSAAQQEKEGEGEEALPNNCDKGSSSPSQPQEATSAAALADLL